MTSFLFWLFGEHDVAYYEWKLAHPQPGWLIALSLSGMFAYVAYFYWRQSGITLFQRIFWSTLRMVLLGMILLMLLDPVIVFEHEVPIRKSVLVLCDASLSMSIHDARGSDKDVAEAALPLGKLPYPTTPRELNAYKALSSANQAALALPDRPVRAIEAQKDAEQALAVLAPLTTPNIKAALDKLLLQQQELRIETEDLHAKGQPLDKAHERQAQIAAVLDRGLESLREPLKLDDAAHKASGAERIELLKGALNNGQLKLLERLQEHNDVHVYRFGDALQELSSDIKDAGAKVAALTATDQGTALGSAIEEAISRHSGQPIAGVIVFTDGGANKGVDPVEAARRAGKAGAPVLPVGIGVTESHDVVVRKIAAQEVAYVGDEIPVRVQIESHGYTKRNAELILKLGADEIARRTVLLNGSTQIEELRIKPQQTGAYVLEARVPAFDDESNKENNKAQQFLRVTDERVKVIYVEGSPRWEYRYLRQVLLRDQRLDVKFVMTEGDPDLPKNSPMYLAEFPNQAETAYKFDLVIVGDVDASKFSPEQMTRIEEMVRKQGASFLMLGGHFYAPRAYAGTPLAKILPVETTNAGWMIVPPAMKIRLTPEGERSSVMKLDNDETVNRGIWTLVSPMYDLPRLAGIKPGATVLATLSTPLIGADAGGATYPLISWQRYGAGKSMFVATDQLWRLRFKRGDRYHVRFWSQAIQVLTFSRLLGENKRMRIETDQKEYQRGDRVQLTVNACNEMYEPLKAAQVSIVAQPQAKGEKPQLVTLQALPDSPGIYQGYYTTTAEGIVAFSGQDAAKADSNTAEVNVVDKPLELQDSELQETLLRQMAQQSGGRYFQMRDLASLPDWLNADQQTAREQSERRLGLPAFLLILLCASMEWFMRRRNDLC